MKTSATRNPPNKEGGGRAKIAHLMASRCSNLRGGGPLLKSVGAKLGAIELLGLFVVTFIDKLLAHAYLILF